ncbi:hypothetical protein DM02DRAFT_366603 [Periconia macrospinosa]|uniref:Uncharacterized protein n=1 Tax=Periconia macrospinosa TaxID=97972 RepID=A0A2V1DSG9_9PLEO|nr:hypothetical protein DM02DRAFT_366603 [Periconia macrospinosa]
MDAKPQRPMRALRIRDENAQPQAQAGKTIHQRNKSTPALSTMAHPGGLKANGVKRQAFADVSNVTRQVVKDDLQVSGKAKDSIVLKDPVGASTKDTFKPNALLRPAQRPLSHAASKANLLTNSGAVASAIPKHVTLDTHHTVNIPKAVSKKVTSIFRETHSDPAAEAAAVPLPSQQSIKNNATHITKALTQEEAVATLVTVEKVLTKKPAEAAKVAVREEQSATYIETKQTREYVEALEKKARVIEQERNEELSKAYELPGGDLEEYWDEEDEEEEYFDADGYTTTHTMRSRIDTTGGVTLNLAPRVTSRTKRELEAAKKWVEENKSNEDIEDELWDTSMVAEYGDEIFEYMHVLEEKLKPNSAYMDLQAEIQWSMRAVLMDWLVQVHNRFTLLPETLFLAVNYIDRFLSAKVVSLGKLQLVGATALFLAAKYEEINCPSVTEIVYMVDGAYTGEEVLKAERFMLSMLQFELGWPGPMSFLRRISKADDYDLETRTLAKYFLEITIMDERFVACAPSFLAAAAHCLARFMLKKGEWSQAHVHYSGYTLSQLRQILIVMLECCENPQKHHSAVYEKYQDKRYKRASLFVETEIQRGFQIPLPPRDSLAGQTQSWRRK